MRRELASWIRIRCVTSQSKRLATASSPIDFPTVARLAGLRHPTSSPIQIKRGRLFPNPSKRFLPYRVELKPGNRFRDALSTGAPGHTIQSDMDHQPEDVVVEKNRFGGFIGSQGRLEAELRGRGIDTLLITGTVTNICCETTAREAAALAFKTVMVEDANAARNDEEHNATLSTFLQAMGDVLPCETVMAALRASSAGAPADAVDLAS